MSGDVTAAIESARAYVDRFEGWPNKTADSIRVLLAEVERLRAEALEVRVERDQFRYEASFVPGLVAERDGLRAEREALHALHREVHPVFSWNSGIRYEEPCPDCHGAPGVHACGCWADAQVEYVCAECHRLGGPAKSQWPCPTAAVLTADPEADQ